MSTSGLKLSDQSEAETRADWAAYHERQAHIWDMKADNFPPDDPSIQGCRDKAEHYRAIALRYRGAE